jgi:hypothetical protein
MFPSQLFPAQLFPMQVFSRPTTQMLELLDKVDPRKAAIAQ